MSRQLQARVPRGMRDFLPETMIRRQYVIGVVSKVFEEFGFEPLQTPSLELAETLLGKYGPEAEKLIYQARHPGGKEELALRYDLSVPLCRLVAMHRGQLRLPFKRYHIAPVWRAERPQRGRYREFHQCDIDIVGTASLLADAEIVQVIHALLTRLGFSDFTVHLNSRKILNGIGRYSGVPAEKLGSLYRSIDKLDKIGMEGVEQELMDNQIPSQAISRLKGLLQIEGEGLTLLGRLKKELLQDPEGQQGIADLEEILGHLKALGVPESQLRIQFNMVRGLDYYDGIIYETTIEEPKMPSITGGGRYDNLIGLFMKDSLPAVGTSFGIERIIDAMQELSMFPDSVRSTVVQALVTLFGPELASNSLQAAQRLRQAGIHTELYFEAASLKSQFKYANRKGIPCVVVIGPDEAQQGRVTVRNFSTGQQVQLSLSEMPSQIRNWVHDRT
ncbi:MAG: histidine--tRNA ligase [Acidobacteriota bacterium]